MDPPPLVEYAVLVRVSSPAAVLLRLPPEDVLGAPCPSSELLRVVSEGGGVSPFAVAEPSGALFFGVRAGLQLDEGVVVVCLSRTPRFEFMLGAVRLMAAAPNVHVLHKHMLSLLTDVPHPAGDRVSKIIWAVDSSITELVFGSPTAKCGLPYGDDEAFRRLFAGCGSMDVLVTLFEAVACEENVVLCSRASPHVLAPVVEALKVLLHPFSWQGLYVPFLCASQRPSGMASAKRVLRTRIPFLVGVDLSQDEVKKLVSSSHTTHILDLDTRALDSLGKNHHFLPADMRERLLRVLNQDIPRTDVDGIRIALCRVFVNLLANFKKFIVTFSRVGGDKKELGFNAEGFLSACADSALVTANTTSTSTSTSTSTTTPRTTTPTTFEVSGSSFLRCLIASRAFGEFVTRQGGATSDFELLCQSWIVPEGLPVGVRELLVSKYGYTDRGARAVWERLREHMSLDESSSVIFSSDTKFKDLVRDMNVPKDGLPTTLGTDQLFEKTREARLDALLRRDKENGAPPLVLTCRATSSLAPAPIAGFDFSTLLAVDDGLCSRRGVWVPSRDHVVHLSRWSTRLTFFALTDQANLDDVASWWRTSVFGTKPKPLLAYSAAPISSSSSSSSMAFIPKTNADLACAIKWSHFQARKMACDVNEIFLLLLEKEHAARYEQTRALVRQVSSSSTEASSLANPTSTARLLAQAEARSESLEHEVRKRDLEIMNLQRQLKALTEPPPVAAAAAAAAGGGAQVRKTQPVLSSSPPASTLGLLAPDRPTSPTLSVSSSLSGLWMPVTSSFASVGPSSSPPPPTAEAAATTNPARRHSTGDLNAGLSTPRHSNSHGAGVGGSLPRQNSSLGINTHLTTAAATTTPTHHHHVGYSPATAAHHQYQHQHHQPQHVHQQGSVSTPPGMDSFLPPPPRTGGGAVMSTPVSLLSFDNSPVQPGSAEAPRFNFERRTSSLGDYPSGSPSFLVAPGGGVFVTGGDMPSPNNSPMSRITPKRLSADFATLVESGGLLLGPFAPPPAAATALPPPPPHMQQQQQQQQQQQLMQQRESRSDGSSLI